MPSDCGTLIWGGALYLERRCGSQGAGRIEGSASSVAGRPLACGRLPARSRPACRQRRTGVRRAPTPDDCPGSRAWVPRPTTEAPIPPSNSWVRSCLPGWHRQRRRNRTSTAEGSSCEARPAAASGSRVQWPGCPASGVQFAGEVNPGRRRPVGPGPRPGRTDVGPLRTSDATDERNVAVRVRYVYDTWHRNPFRPSRRRANDPREARRIPHQPGRPGIRKGIRAENDREETDRKNAGRPVAGRHWAYGRVARGHEGGAGGLLPKGRRSPGLLPPAHGPNVERDVIQRVRVVSAITRPSSGQRVA
ncbi:hypothetical protein GGP55_001234 [Salinibacter ruber]|nr:hypothetical protein [Salinibacter ruber]